MDTPILAFIVEELQKLDVAADQVDALSSAPASIRLRSLRLDSLDKLMLGMQIEEKFQIELDIDKVDDEATIGALCDLVTTLVSEKI